MSRRSRPRLASARLLQREADLDSEDDFIDIPRPRAGRSRSGESSSAGAAPSQLLTASERVSRAVQRGLSVISGAGGGGQPSELGERFPFLNRGKRVGSKLNKSKKQGKRITWKTIPCCLSGPHATRVPTRDLLDGLCREGLGTLWFSKDQEPLELELLDAQEFHFQIVCLYPSLKNVPYEICRAGGPGHQVLVALHIDDPTKTPSSDRPFTPFFDVEHLKELIGRKGRLYIRPVIPIRGCTRMSEVEVCELGLCN